jgi:hypothetical protein
MDATCSSETSVLTRPTRRNIPEDTILQSVGSQLTFRRNKSPPSSGSKNKPKIVACSLCAWFILQPRRWMRHVLPKRRLTFNGLRHSISQKMQLQVTTAVRPSSSTLFFTEKAYISVFRIFQAVRIVIRLLYQSSIQFDYSSIVALYSKLCQYPLIQL